MNDDSVSIVIRDESEGKSVNLPVDREQLGAFISGLLGQQQSIEREVYGTFDVDHNWMIHVNSLINQRITQQNPATLTSFNAVIFYENHLKRTLNSIEAFEHFSETKNIISTGVKLTWTYLVNFPSKSIPEKQEIFLYLSSKAPASSAPSDPIRRMISPRHKLGVISYGINHTERTWADDIEYLLRQEIDLVVGSQSRTQYLLSIIFGLSSLLFFAGGILIPDMVNDIVQSKQISDLYQNYKDVMTLKASSFDDVGLKLDLALKTLNPSNSIAKVSFFYKIIMAIAGLGMSIWCIDISEREEPCFVVMSRATEEYRKKKIAKRKRSWLINISSFFLSVVAGVIGNYIYYIIST